MVKTLRYWQNRETTLQIGEEIYSGKVIRSYVPPRRSGRSAYYFQLSNGEKIRIGRNSLKCVDGCLVKKLNSSKMIH